MIFTIDFQKTLSVERFSKLNESRSSSSSAFKRLNVWKKSQMFKFCFKSNLIAVHYCRTLFRRIEDSMMMIHSCFIITILTFLISEVLWCLQSAYWTLTISVHHHHFIMKHWNLFNAIWRLSAKILIMTHAQLSLNKSVVLAQSYASLFSLQNTWSSFKLTSYKVSKSLTTSRAAAFRNFLQTEIVFDSLIRVDFLLMHLYKKSCSMYTK